MSLRALLLPVLAGTTLAVFPAAPAAAAACSQGAGVTVVVDFASLGGGSRVGCATGDPSSGVAALRAAGFTPTRAAQEPGYFVCRINGKPANDPCQRTSPADAYWSYWHAKPGGSWSYATSGANDDDPAPGTVDGWAFGAGKPPSTPPPKPAAAPASPTPRASAPRSPAALPAVRQRASAGPVRGGTPTAAAGSTAAALPAATPAGGSATDGGVPSPVPASAPPDAAPSTPRSGGAGGALVAALVVALLIATAAGTVVRRRRGGSG